MGHILDHSLEIILNSPNLIINLRICKGIYPLWGMCGGNTGGRGRSTHVQMVQKNIQKDVHTV